MDLSRYQLNLLREDTLSALYRGVPQDGGASVLLVTATSPDTVNECRQRSERALSLVDRFDGKWAAVPISIERVDGREFFVLQDGGGNPLTGELGKPFDIERFLAIATSAAAAVKQVHERGLIHRDLRPDRLLADDCGHVRLWAFGKAGPQTTLCELPAIPQAMLDSLPYVSPEQTGRMKRPVDNRSDLYSLGVIFYQMLTGELPFMAADATEWIHSHVARRPIPPRERHAQVPPVLEAIVLKLLSKNSEDRYQTAGGLESDLRRCLNSLTSTGCVEDFEVATADAGKHLPIPEKLYGRSSEIRALNSTFDFVRSQHGKAVTLVSGVAGVGKSSLIRELRKSFTSADCLFASGKFDQYSRDIPYTTIGQAFRGLVRQILGSGDAELARWRSDLREALGRNGQLITNLIPELTLVIGEQPPAQEMQPHEEKKRFNVVFRRFVKVFARPEHPLILFIDDVQWLDLATIELIEKIMLGEDVANLLLICAYRDDEVRPGHLLLGAREALRAGVCYFDEIRLGPLDNGAIKDLLADTFQKGHRSVASLATLIEQKTGGNPFFVLHFLEALEIEGSLFHDHQNGGWTWDEDRIRATRITDNVADLVVSKIGRLPPRALEILKLMSCLGNGASATILSVITGKPKQEVVGILWDAVEGGLLVRTDEDFALVHDRVQEAAYRMVPEAERSHMHFIIGRALMDRLPADILHKRVFEVADQLGRGMERALRSSERERIAELFLKAGLRAKAAVAYQSALTYLRAALKLVEESEWDRYSLRFPIELATAECEYLSGENDVAERHLGDLATRAGNAVDRGAVVGLRSSLYLTRGDEAKAVAVALDYLRDFGIDWTSHPSDSEVRDGVAEVYTLLDGRHIESLVRLPQMSDPEWLAAMEVLAYTILPAIITDGNLEDLIYAQMVSLSLRFGNCDASCYAYVSVIIPLGLRYGDYESGGAFGRLGLDLVDSHGLDRFKARVYSCYGCFVVPWTQHLPGSERYSRQSMDVAVAAADLVFSVTPAQAMVSHLLFRGVHLDLVQQDAQCFLSAAQKTGFSLAADAAISQLLLIEDLRGEGLAEAATQDLPERAAFEKHLRESGPRLKIVFTWYQINRIQAKFIGGDFEGALRAAKEAKNAVDVRSFIEIADFHFYSALAHASYAIGRLEQEISVHLEAIRHHQSQIDVWAKSSPENFNSRSSLLAAEVARIEGRRIEALELYEQAIKSARKYGFVQTEAIASELAWRFCARNGLMTTSENFFGNARACYAAWGATAKVRWLDEERSNAQGHSDQINNIRTEQQPIDVSAVVAMSQAVSGEIVLDRLIERLMVTVVEHSGAVRGLLLLPHEGEISIVAEAVTNDAGISVELHTFERQLPETILAYVTRTQSVVILDGIQNDHPFIHDPYVREAPSTSILCLPIVKLKQLVGILYLENGLSTNLFTEDQVAVLRLLASQAAISLENAALYKGANDAQERARRAAEELRLAYDMIPALAWNSDVDGTLLSFNKQWHDYTGLTREQSMGDGWARAIHPDDIGKVARKWREVLEAGEAGEIEGRMIRFDGVARSFLIRATPMRDERGTIIKWYGTNIDIDDLKKMEEAQELLARAGRLTALGEMTASIAHEVNQPLMAIVMNAATCLRWLSDDQLDIAEARDAAERIIRDGHRAGDVITSIRALARKSPLVMEKVDVNAMIHDVLALTRGELQRHGILLETSLDETTGFAVGDRIQLQQVLLNLILNAIEAINSGDETGKQIWVSSGRTLSGDVLVSVGDSGPGVHPDKAHQIFDAFFTSKPGGLGMGLSICRSIVEAHGGKLSVAARQSRGSTFTFTVKSGEVFRSA